MRKTLVAIISPPGGGKSTVLSTVAGQFDVPILSSGDIARQMQKDMQDNFILAGNFAPEDEMRKRLKNSLTDLYKSNSVVLADGFPRFIEQCEWIKENFPDVNLVLYHLDVPYNVAIERLKTRNREDDQLKTIEDRVKKYDELTKPIVEHYNVPHYNYDFLAQVIGASNRN